MIYSKTFYSVRVRALFALVVAAMVLVLTACSSSDAADNADGSGSDESGANGETISVEHLMGTTEIPNKPERVVALEFSFVDALMSLDVAPVGIADDEDAERIAQLAGDDLEYTSVGTRSEPNQEIISSLAPDLIIADSDRHSGVYEQLSQIAPTIVLNSREGTYDDMKENTVAIAKSLGEEQQGIDKVAAHEQEMADLAARVPADEKRTVQLATARDELLRFHTDASFVGSVLTELGLDVPVKGTEAYEDSSLERVADVNPDVMFISSDVDVPITDKWESNPLWQNLTAVKNDEVFEADRNLYTRFRGLDTAVKVAEDALTKLGY